MNFEKVKYYLIALFALAVVGVMTAVSAWELFTNYHTQSEKFSLAALFIFSSLMFIGIMVFTYKYRDFADMRINYQFNGTIIEKEKKSDSDGDYRYCFIVKPNSESKYVKQAQRMNELMRKFKDDKITDKEYQNKVIIEVSKFDFNYAKLGDAINVNLNELGEKRYKILI